MSEYWVSKKKYFCKYCDIYIADDAPSRQHHENGMRHKGNVDRFIRGIYKTGEKQKKDAEEEKRDMKRVEQAAAAAFAQDVGAGLAKASSGPVASTSTSADGPKKPPPKPSNPYANYSTAASLGYTDPDAERIARELEARRSQGIAGEWQVITPAQAPAGLSLGTTPPLDGDGTVAVDGGMAVGMKREAEGPPLEEDTRTFKLMRKTLNAGLGEIHDPGAIPIKIKKKEEPAESSLAQKPQLAPVSVKSEQGANLLSQAAGSSNLSIKWAKPQWAAPLPDLKQEDRETIFGFKHEEAEDSLAAAQAEESMDRKPDIKAEDDGPPIPAAPLFKKRKAPTNAGRGRRET